MSDFKSKMHQIQFRYSAPPDPLAGFKGSTSKGREGREGKGGKGGGERRGMGWDGREGKGGEGGREGEGSGGEKGEDVEGPGKWSAPGPVPALDGPDYLSSNVIILLLPIPVNISFIVIIT